MSFGGREPGSKRSIQEEDEDDDFKCSKNKAAKISNSPHPSNGSSTSSKIVENYQNIPVFLQSITELTEERIIATLRQAENGQFAEKILSNPPIKPKAGCVFLYQKRSPTDRRYLDDQYNGFRDNGRKDIRRTFKKVYYQMKLKVEGSKTRKPVNFKKLIYFLLEPAQKNNPIVMIHYVGDDTAYIHQSHGNGKQNRPYTRTSADTKEKIKHLVKDYGCAPKKIYEKLVREPFVEEKTAANAEQYELIDTPRDLEQVKNFKKSNARKTKISKCEIFSIYELAKSDLANFVRKMELVPHDIIVVSEPSTIEIANQLLKSSNNDTSLPQLVCYDTTFELTDSYVSVLVMRNVFLYGNPIMPIAMMIHDRKLKEVHETFWSTMLKALDLSVLADRIPICCDREAAISSAIRKVIPGANLFSCTNHIKQDIQFWLKGHGGGSKDDLTTLSKQMTLLIDSENPTEYSQLLDAFKQKWSEGFLQYYESSIEKDLVASSNYNTQQFAAFLDCPPTNNISESVNFVIKSHTNWKELPLDTLVLKFIELQCCNLSEYIRASKNLGKYRIKEGYHKFAIWRAPPYIHYTDSEFAKSVKAALEPDEYLKPDQVQSKEILAKRCLELKLISHIPEQRMFVVRSPYAANKIYNVTRNVNDKSTKREFICSCQGNGSCYHIIAVKMSLGDAIHDDSAVYKLSVVKKKARQFKGRLGRKKPNMQDLMANVKPANDSAIGNDNQSVCSRGSNSIDLDFTGIKMEDMQSSIKNQTSFCPDLAADDVDQHGFNITEEDKPKYSCVESNPIFDEIILKKVKCGPKGFKQYLKKYPSLKQNTWIEGSIIDRVILGLLNTLQVSNVLYIEEFIYQTVWKNGSPCHVASYARQRDGLNKDVFLVTVPTGNHWMLGVVLLRTKTIYLLDSRYFCSGVKLRLESFECLLKIVHISLVSGGMRFKKEEWALIYACDAPRQLDGTECGVIVCLMAYALMCGLPFPSAETLSEQNHLRNRRWMLANLESNVIPTYPDICPGMPREDTKTVPLSFPVLAIRETEISIETSANQIINALLDDES